MTITRRTFGLGAAGALIAPVAAPLVRRASAAGPTIRVGVVNSMSGSLAAYAQEGQPAFEYMIRKINAEGGIHSKGGAQIELVMADDTSQPARTAAEARRLITEEKVQLLTGTILSAQMLALTPVLDELKVPTLSVWAGGAHSSYMFTLGYPYDRGYAQTMHDFVVSLRDDGKFPIKTAVMGYSNYEAGQQVNKFLTEKLKASNIEIIGEAALDIRAQDQTAAMVRIRSLKPDVVVGLVTPRDGILLHQARYNLNYHGSIFCGGTGGYTDLSLWKDLGPEIGKAVLTRNLFGMTGFSTGARIESMQKIIAELRDVAKLDRIGQGAIQYAQAARVLQQVLENATSLESEALLSAFKKLDIPYGDPNLYVAKPQGLQFAEDRLLKDGSAMFIQWTADQEQQVVFPKIFAQAAPRAKS
ncbi:ABC transporter substrate-binding protein [Bradyrhizobium sp. U87765 SZCCT0131]|uniref:ABC transporter substrate-binding protein n=1 Tax=unclassified Bradyrhizobium TaxID=2631580 RepID=UPI001BA9FDD4|nr:MULTISPECIES: ABC transporter substrate-binding protein [unclassified Bradyrhizobium]MBR1217671.1 ABC transporter substrate-binding protein [Bradyrhizobium sp. U87765 SZCCT0131]MBR1261383.1 ABC transporter substrate-binding protein [Bradyrhizobium sp. U87765 SZCCT0134]MBR1303169.1 ABC transporter substrate-binding protein [Bradyrhizobium sp. U87765 SZCCT0110]MBR1318775.1 ABC transporter substrate-binding protein [Bradyrhizobium sp. U87765 SZCCT0109]MBR1347100.1 ABC transporter substrate-bin